ncbi:copper chaperone PCu(A)C [Massilia sp. TSP1-1-2]|uniref:copper chaperone PCu(A)C n=1 Tax=unclassified Massilia TaxID=2609279 RepID=UPI003CEE5F55
MNKLFAATFLLSLLSGAAQAQAQVSVTAPWVRATVPAQASTGAFMHVQSATAVRLVGVRSPVAATVELHKMEMTGSMMKMGAVDGIDLPAGKVVNLASGGYHIMLTGLKRQLKAGEAIELTLLVRGKDGKGDSVTVKVPVKPMTFVSPQAVH